MVQGAGGSREGCTRTLLTFKDPPRKQDTTDDFWCSDWSRGSINNLPSSHANKGRREKSWRYIKNMQQTWSSLPVSFCPLLPDQRHLSSIAFLPKFFIYWMNFGFYTSSPPGYLEMAKLRMDPGAAAKFGSGWCCRKLGGKSQGDWVLLGMKNTSVIINLLSTLQPHELENVCFSKKALGFSFHNKFKFNLSIQCNLSFLQWSASFDLSHIFIHLAIEFLFIHCLIKLIGFNVVWVMAN